MRTLLPRTCVGPVLLPRVRSVNGRYVQTKGLMEERVMDYLLEHLDDRRRHPDTPFLAYYALHAIHQ